MYWQIFKYHLAFIKIKASFRIESYGLVFIFS